ncbi:Fic family protein [Luteimonas sp. Y-2-2-4F]|nr:Fic family protein [Luteimonas sp. Y-2-2-4F]MCD9032529.1 Fic family protein [Luteimonas sp. Y-2-2-4F]
MDELVACLRREDPARPHHWRNAPFEVSLPLIALLSSASARSPARIAPGDPVWRALSGQAHGGRLFELAGAVSTGPVRFREQIAFAGGHSPSTARIVFAPHAVIPGLFGSLEKTISGTGDRWHPVEFAAVLAYFVLHLHPFDDANGRFARLLVLNEASRSGALWAGAAMSVLMVVAREELASSWVAARREGLQAYLESSTHFVQALFDHAATSGLSETVIRMGEAARRACASGAVRRMLYELIVGGSIALSRVREIAGCSTRKAEGLLDALAREGAGVARKSVVGAGLVADVTPWAREIAEGAVREGFRANPIVQGEWR